MVNAVRARYTWALNILPVIPLAIFWIFLVQVSINIPVWDDYDSVLYFLTTWQDQGLFERIQSFFAQHNEHRVITIRFFCLLQYYLFGSVNFQYLALIAHLFISISYLFVWVWISKNSDSKTEAALLATSIGLIFFQPQYGDGLVWVSAALSSFPAVAFAISTFIFLENRRASCFVGALVLGLLAPFTLGNGLLVLVLGAFELLLLKRWRRFFVWCLWSGLVIALFFWGYKRAEYKHSSLELWTNLGTTTDYFFTVLGSIWGWSQRSGSVNAGILITVVSFLGIATGLLRGRSPMAIMPQVLFLFAVGSAALLTYTRSHLGYEFVLSPSRYTSISVLATVSCIFIMQFLLVNRKLRTWSAAAVLLIAVYFSFCSYQSYANRNYDFKIRLVADLASWMIGEPGLTYPWPDRSNAIMRDSLKRGIYVLPEFRYGRFINDGPSALETATKDAPQSKGRKGDKATRNQIVYQMTRLVDADEYVLVEGWAVLRGVDSLETEITILLESAEGGGVRLFQPVRRSRGPGPGGRYVELNRADSAFFGLIPVNELKDNAPYRLGLLLTSPAGSYYTWLEQWVSEREDKKPLTDKD